MPRTRSTPLLRRLLSQVATELEFFGYVNQLPETAWDTNELLRHANARIKKLSSERRSLEVRRCLAWMILWHADHGRSMAEAYADHMTETREEIEAWARDIESQVGEMGWRRRSSAEGISLRMGDIVEA